MANNQPTLWENLINLKFFFFSVLTILEIFFGVAIFNLFLVKGITSLTDILLLILLVGLIHFVGGVKKETSESMRQT